MSTESLEAQLRNLQVSNRRSRAAAGRSNNGGTKESDIINHLMSALALGLRMKGGPITGRINKMERRPKNAFMRAREEVKNEMIAAGATAQEIRALQREVSREAANRASRRLRALNAEIQPDQTNQVERRPKNAFMRAREEVKNEMIAAGATAQQVRARQREISREAANRASRGRHASNIVVQPDHQHAGVSLVAASPNMPAGGQPRGTRRAMSLDSSLNRNSSNPANEGTSADTEETAVGQDIHMPGGGDDEAMDDEWTML